MSVSSVLFDLDGTLVDPAGSITSGIRYALVAHGVNDPGEAFVEALVGPPLQIGLRTIDGVDDENIDAIIETYRARYAEVGMAQSKLYPGIKELLGFLRAQGIHVAVTTAKPIGIAKELIAAQRLEDALDAIHGNDSEHGSHGSSKAHIIAAALKHADLDPESSVVVGDRHYDITAAKDNGVQSIGVQWGFAQGTELDAADYQAADVGALAVLLLGEQASADFNFHELMQKGAQ